MSSVLPLEGILASRIPGCVHPQRVFSSKAGLHYRWSELADSMPSTAGKAEGDNVTFLPALTSAAHTPKVNRKQLEPKLLPGAPLPSQTLSTVVPWTVGASPRGG